MKIFIDDERFPKDVTWIALDNAENYTVVRNFHQFVTEVEKMLEQNVIPEISFDHDLADFFDLNETDELTRQYGIFHSDKIELTGFSCLKYLIDRILDLGMHDKVFNVFHTFHTQNPIMRERMQNEWDFFTNFDF